VNFFIAQGSGSLSAASAVTNTSGYASVNLTLTNFTANIQLSACVAPANNPCQSIYGNPVSATLLNLQAVAGQGQVVAGTSFQPLVFRVTDSSRPPNPILGADVVFQSTVLRPSGNDMMPAPGDPIVTQTGTPVILGASQTSVQSDANGLASLVPSVGSFSGPLLIEIQVSAGTAAVMQDVLESVPATTGSISPPTRSRWQGSVLGPWGFQQELEADAGREDDGRAEDRPEKDRPEKDRPEKDRGEDDR
jgi:hypothetical protein